TLAATLVVLVALALLAAAFAYLLPRLVSETAELGTSLRESATQIRHWLVTGPFHLSERQVDDYLNQVAGELNSNTSRIIHGAVNSAAAAIEVTVGVVLTIVLTFFFVKDGEALVERGI